MTRVVLVPNPLQKSEGGKIGQETYVPLGLLSLATILKSEGVDVQILDVNHMSHETTSVAVAEAILRHQPDIVGFSTMCNNYSIILKIASECKRIRPGLKIVFGGPQASITDVQTLKAFPFVDCIVRGESEQIISRVIRSLHQNGNAQGIPGVTTRNGNSVLRCAPLAPVDLDHLQPPDYALYPYIDLAERIPIDVGRGCPFNCYFCCTNKFWNREFRLRPTESIISTMRQLNLRYGFNRFGFEHDNLTASRERVLSLCDAIEKESLNISWGCSARIDCLDLELLQRMAKAGCSSIYIGIETGSSRMQHIIGKKLNLENAVEIFRQITAVGMNYTASFIIGFPEEEISDLLQTLDLMLEIRFAGKGDESLQLHLLAPLPGTSLMNKHNALLRFDGCFSDQVGGVLDEDDINLIINYPDIFAAHYYFDTPNIKRQKLLQIHSLFLCLQFLPYSAYILWKGRDFCFPNMFLDRLECLELPSVKSGLYSSNVKSVADFLQQVLRETGFGNHYVQDVIEYELASHQLIKANSPTIGSVTQKFNYDIESLIYRISINEIKFPPDFLEPDDHWLLLTNQGGQLKSVRLTSSIAHLLEV